MFHISSCFYSERFRKLVDRLKKEGTLKEGPLYELDKTVYLVALPFVILCSLFFLIEGYLRVDLLVLVLFLWVVLSAFAVRYTINKIIIPYTIGVLKPVFLEDDPQYHPVLLSIWGWTIRYSAYDDFGNLGASYKSPHIPKELFDKDEFLSSPVEAYFDPENPERNCPKVLGLVKKFKMIETTFEGEAA